MIRRREDLGLVFVTGLGSFKLGALKASRNQSGGIDLFDEARERYLFVRQPPQRFGALTDGEALRWLEAQIESVPDFSGYGSVPEGTLDDTLKVLIERTDEPDIDYAAVFRSGLEEI